jgi:hypothetical protein
MTSTFRSFSGALLCAALAFAPAAHAAEDAPRTAGPYVPTPQVIVDRMLQFGNVTASDFVIDLGSGDGRIVRTAAKTFGASGFGVDIDGELVERSNSMAQREGIADRAKFYREDVFKADLTRATLLTLYVLPEMMANLRPKLLTELKPGTRIVSHDYHFGDWLPDNRVSFDVPEKAEAVGFSSTTLYHWVVPANVGGRWRLQVEGVKMPEATLELQQKFQMVNGKTQAGARRSDIGNVSLNGRTFEFAADFGADPKGHRYTYSGTVQGDTMEGEVVWGMDPRAKRHRWKAVRVGEAPTLAR